MGVLRELITRFGFDVDKKDVNKYDKTVGSMSKKALKLGAIFGGAFTFKGIVDAGLSAERTSFILGRLAGTDFSKFQNMLVKTRKELDSIKAGAGDLITDKNFNLSAINFVEEFGHGNDALKLFNTLLSFSSKQSAITGGNLNEIMATLQQGIKTGDFSFLKKLPEFDQVSVNRLNALNKIFDPNELGGSIGLRQKSAKLSGFLGQAERSQVSSLANIPDNIFEANRATKQFNDAADKTGAITTNALVPAIQFMTDGTKRANDFVEAISEIPDKGVKGALFDLDPPKPIFKGSGTINRNPVNQNDSPTDSNSKSEINMTNHINITSDDPRKTGAEIENRLNGMVKKARSQLIKTEDR